MKLGSRLESVASLVPLRARLADVGTDHAYLPLWLLQKSIIEFAVATDIARGPCAAARLSVEKNGASAVISVRQGDGLAAVRPGEVDTVVIAGMGASLILDILHKGQAALSSVENLIIQPMTAGGYLRRELCGSGWRIDKEQLATERGRLYEIILFKKGKSSLYSELEYEIGPYLIRNKHPLLPRQIEKIRNSCFFVVSAMKNSEHAMDSEKYQKKKALLAELERLLCQ